MHHASLSSKRLQRVLKLLKSGKPFSTLDIFRKAKVCAVSAIVSELRAHGFTIHCQRKGNIWTYQLN